MSITDTIARLIGSESSESEDPQDDQPGDDAPNAISILKADHRHVEKLFQEALSEDASAIGKRRATIREICDALTLHTKLEEKFLYPAVRQKSKRDSQERDDTLEAIEEHAGAKDLIRKIRRSTGRDETLKAKVTVLKEMIEHHVKEEESQFFGEAEKLLGKARMHEIGAQIEKAKRRASAPKKKTTRRAAAKPRASGRKAR